MNRAHGHDEISIKMHKLCESVISKQLYLIFKNCLSSNTFLDVWKKANVITVHKKDDKEILQDYRSMSLLPICSKIFEKVIFNALYIFFEDHQSCVKQLVSITYKVYFAFDCNPLGVRCVFLDLSKAFDDKV